MVFIKVATSPPSGVHQMGKEARVGAGFWGSALTVKRDLGLGEGRSALCLIKDVTRRPLLIKGRNSSGPEFRGWAPRDLTPYYVLFPLLKCPDWVLGSQV